MPVFNTVTSVENTADIDLVCIYSGTRFCRGPGNLCGESRACGWTRPSLAHYRTWIVLCLLASCCRSEVGAGSLVGRVKISVAMVY